MIPAWVAPVLSGVKWLGDFLVKLGSLLVPYWLGRSKAKEAATEAAIERLDDAGKAIDRVQSDPDELERLRQRFRQRGPSA